MLISEARWMARRQGWVAGQGSRVESGHTRIWGQHELLLQRQGVELRLHHAIAILLGSSRSMCLYLEVCVYMCLYMFICVYTILTYITVDVHQIVHLRQLHFD